MASKECHVILHHLSENCVEVGQVNVSREGGRRKDRGCGREDCRERDAVVGAGGAHSGTKREAGR